MVTTTPTKLHIEVLSKDGSTVKDIDVQYNPPDYTVTKGAQIAEIGIPGLDSPVLQFIRGTNEQIAMKLFFDTTGDGSDVREKTQEFYRLVKIDPDLHAPPVCRLSWGKPLGGWAGPGSPKEVKFHGIVSDITQRFVLFKLDGTPLRAELDVTFKEYKTIEIQRKELRQKSADHSKVRTVRSGDTLSGIAAEVYNDPGQWRIIANKNNLYDLRLVPGQVLRIPPLD